MNRKSRRSVLRGAFAYFFAWRATAPASLAAAQDLAAQPSRPFPSRSAIAAIQKPFAGQRVFLAEPGREGIFTWEASDCRAKVAADPRQGVTIKARDIDPLYGAWVRVFDILTPQMFGASGKGDDTEALQGFCNHLDDGLIGEISLRHTVSSQLLVSDKAHFTLRGRDTAEIRATDGMPVAYGYGLLRFRKCHFFAVRDILFDGNRKMRAPVESTAHAVIFQSCSDFTCTRVGCVNSVTDGFYLASATPAEKSTHCSRFDFIDCRTDNCFRQGCSVIEGNSGRFIGGVYAGSNGTAPSAGIDLESNGGTPDHAIENIILTGVQFRSNDGYGLQISPMAAPRDIRIIDCLFDDNGHGAILWGATSGSILRPKVSGFSNKAVRGAIDIPAGKDVGNVTIADPVFDRIAATRSNLPLVYVHAASAGGVTITGMTANSCATAVIFRARNCKLVDSPHIRSDRANYNGAIAIAGPNCVISGNHISDFYGVVISADGPGAVIEGNILTNPRFNDKDGCIRSSAAGTVIRNNRISRSIAGTGYGIVALARPARLEGNSVSGFSGHPYVLRAGRPIQQPSSTNRADGRAWDNP
ncbi:right-handed parallel beta-helix repeat-containing protein [Sphingomonas sp. SCN 67-18]|uniref:right-handed parallel beta-helix repeat-containing protein n=1 Tax=uncultured Sphingomonas sp. TaxID=158754 RepID=UPI0025CCCCE0|nr:right-handed parallel beta-helix repeat-containing protein [Sphingomonas sp. SCN 67-18]